MKFGELVYFTAKASRHSTKNDVTGIGTLDNSKGAEYFVIKVDKYLKFTKGEVKFSPHFTPPGFAVDEIHPITRLGKVLE